MSQMLEVARPVEEPDHKNNGHSITNRRIIEVDRGDREPWYSTEPIPRSLLTEAKPDDDEISVNAPSEAYAGRHSKERGRFKRKLVGLGKVALSIVRKPKHARTQVNEELSAEEAQDKRSIRRILAAGAAAISLVTLAGVYSANNSNSENSPGLKSNTSQSDSLGVTNAFDVQYPNQTKYSEITPKTTAEPESIVIARVPDEGSIWGTIRDNLPEHKQIDGVIDPIKDQELKERNLPDTPEGWSQIQPGDVIEFEIPR